MSAYDPLHRSRGSFYGDGTPRAFYRSSPPGQPELAPRGQAPQRPKKQGPSKWQLLKGFVVRELDRIGGEHWSAPDVEVVRMKMEGRMNTEALLRNRREVAELEKSTHTGGDAHPELDEIDQRHRELMLEQEHLRHRKEELAAQRDRAAYDAMMDVRQRQQQERLERQRHDSMARDRQTREQAARRRDTFDPRLNLPTRGQQMPYVGPNRGISTADPLRHVSEDPYFDPYSDLARDPLRDHMQGPDDPMSSVYSKDSLRQYENDFRPVHRPRQTSSGETDRPSWLNTLGRKLSRLSVPAPPVPGNPYLPPDARAELNSRRAQAQRRQDLYERMRGKSREVQEAMLREHDMRERMAHMSLRDRQRLNHGEEGDYRRGRSNYGLGMDDGRAGNARLYDRSGFERPRQEMSRSPPFGFESEPFEGGTGGETGRHSFDHASAGFPTRRHNPFLDTEESDVPRHAPAFQEPDAQYDGPQSSYTDRTHPYESLPPIHTRYVRDQPGDRRHDRLPSVSRAPDVYRTFQDMGIMPSSQASRVPADPLRQPVSAFLPDSSSYDRGRPSISDVTSSRVPASWGDLRHNAYMSGSTARSKSAFPEPPRPQPGGMTSGLSKPGSKSRQSMTDTERANNTEESLETAAAQPTRDDSTIPQTNANNGNIPPLNPSGPMRDISQILLPNDIEIMRAPDDMREAALDKMTPQERSDMKSRLSRLAPDELDALRTLSEKATETHTLRPTEKAAVSKRNNFQSTSAAAGFSADPAHLPGTKPANAPQSSTKPNEPKDGIKASATPPKIDEPVLTDNYPLVRSAMLPEQRGSSLEHSTLPRQHAHPLSKDTSAAVQAGGAAGEHRTSPMQAILATKQDATSETADATVNTLPTTSGGGAPHQKAHGTGMPGSAIEQANSFSHPLEHVTRGGHLFANTNPIDWNQWTIHEDGDPQLRALLNFLGHLIHQPQPPIFEDAPEEEVNRRLNEEARKLSQQAAKMGANAIINLRFCENPEGTLTLEADSVVLDR